VDIDAMAPPSLPAAVGVKPIQASTVIDVLPQRKFEAQQAVNQARQMYLDGVYISLTY